jgi:hypothetical protein
MQVLFQDWEARKVELEKLNMKMHEIGLHAFTEGEMQQWDC